ncbi:NDP-hexose 2,3-dehydratase [Streptomyces spiroverticillatus]|uniref:NDP-hexose 2,3-dehydratase n=1 Tax=Streptomyces finlayi TaxID=67296 RepID=A0A918X4X7_9ACTN|nr:NDP-hexose 2,3-dehydratase family protein [Streptomyces finlayi]GHA35876.1 NDP-hexose 2,3-dehydratase [Streptomyces spiroverticillatus]GHD12561.1 NDP-hexose 2,3-dehydratase [Streptomyces finlayi]
MFSSTAEFHHWFAQACAAQAHQVTKVPLDRLEGWSLEERTGNLVHRSGRFFSVQGLDVQRAGRAVDAWQQPILVQPEQGMLGILVKEFHGVPHCLLQAKMEPGNWVPVQLSPTVQATRSNYTGVHGGRPVPYLGHFLDPGRGRVLSDALQSEQAAWFFAKRNRNMIVQTDEDVPLLEGFCWLTFDQIAELLQIDDLINMDTRTVLSGAVGLRPPSPAAAADPDSFHGALAASWDPQGRPLHGSALLLRHLARAKERCTLTRRLVPLADTARWTMHEGVVTHDTGRHFTVLGVRVEASHREVAGWSQPMLMPNSRGVAAFLAKRVNGALHLLVQARTETAAMARVELAPTVQCQPADYGPGARDGQGPAPRLEFLDTVLSARPDQIRFDTVQSEEGGRFYHARIRYALIETDEDFPLEVPPAYTWMTVRQLIGFVRHGGHLNVEARTLLALLGFLPATAAAEPVGAAAHA